MIYDIIVIGAGTAGITAAIYGRRADKSVLIIEGAAYGGQIINTPCIENYPAEPKISGFDYAMRILSQAKDLGAEIRFERVTKVEVSGKNKIVKAKQDRNNQKLYSKHIKQ